MRNFGGSGQIPFFRLTGKAHNSNIKREAGRADAMTDRRGEKRVKKFRWDKKYLHWGVTAFLVIAAAIVFYVIVNHLSWLGATLKSFGRIISPFVWGLVIAYLLYPLMRIYYKGIFLPLWKLLLKRSR